MLILDCEIVNAIPPAKAEDKKPGISYCQGWQDYSGMGISCCCGYSYISGNFLVFLEDNLSSLPELIAKHDLLIGFNNTGFDNPLLAGILNFPVDILNSLSFDIQKEIWRAEGLPAEYDQEIHKGCSLAKTIRANFNGYGKNGSGAKAPELWQAGFKGEVINYCINDVSLTKKLFDRILKSGGLISPISGRFVKIRTPDCRK